MTQKRSPGRKVKKKRTEGRGGSGVQSYNKERRKNSKKSCLTLGEIGKKKLSRKEMPKKRKKGRLKPHSQGTEPRDRVEGGEVRRG